MEELLKIDVPVRMIFQHLSERGQVEWNAAVAQARSRMLAEQLVALESMVHRPPPGVHHTSPGETEPVGGGQA